MNKITVVILDDHALIREAWKMILGEEKYEVILTTGDSHEANSMIRDKKPDLLLLDINMTPLDGFEILEITATASPKTKVIGISAHSQPVYARKMLRGGAKAYVTKNSSSQEFLEAVNEVMAGRKYICSEVKNLITEDALEDPKEDAVQLNGLTEKELQIIQFIKQGFSSKEIAGKLNIVQKTVEVHRHRIFKKLKVKNAASLVQLANQYGL